MQINQVRPKHRDADSHKSHRFDRSKREGGNTMSERNCSNIVKLARAAVFALLAIALLGCAGASVAQQSTSAPVSNNRPTTAYVYPFAVTSQDVTLNQGFFQKTYANLSDENETQSQLQIAENTAQTMAGALVQELQGLGFTASQVARGTPTSGQNVLIVDGEFVDINEGNRLRRMVIGLGLGQSTLDTKVQVYQMANRRYAADHGFHDTRR
jgi:hypothetical protein